MWCVQGGVFPLTAVCPWCVVCSGWCISADGSVSVVCGVFRVCISADGSVSVVCGVFRVCISADGSVSVVCGVFRVVYFR